MSKVLDQSGDLNFRELHQYVRMYNFPEFAKTAELSEIVGPDEEKARFYADVRSPHQFPCHTKAATYVSYLYFLEKQSQVSPKVKEHIQGRLDKFAEYWGIEGDVSGLSDAAVELHKEAEHPDSSYAIVWATNDGRKERRYPIRNELEVKAAAEWFNDHQSAIREEFGFYDRQTIANKILEKASEFNANIVDRIELLEKAAGHGLCDPKKVASMLRDRVKAASRVPTDVENVMDKLAESVEASPVMLMDPDSAGQLADTVDQFDRNYHLLNKYSAAIPAPEDVIFEATTTKVAEVVKTSCTLNTGTIYDVEDFTKISTTDIGDLFGDDFASEVTTGLRVDPVKLASVIPTLPRPDAELFDRLMTDLSIQPMAKQASAERVGFSHTQLQQLAT